MSARSPRGYPTPSSRSPQVSDLRDKLSRRRSHSKSRSPEESFRKKSSSVRSYRERSRSPVRSHSRQISRRTPSPHRGRSRSKSSEFRTPYSPKRGYEGSRKKAADERGSSKARMEKSMPRSEHGRSLSRHPREKSSSRFGRDKSPRESSERSTKSRSRFRSSERKESYRAQDSSPEDAESKAKSSTVVAGVGVKPSVSKMLKKIVSKTDRKKSWKNEKLELVLRKPKKKKHKKNKLEVPIIKTEPATEESSPPPPAAVMIKSEPGSGSPPTSSTLPAAPSLPYFKPRQEVELQPIIGHSQCRICESYYPDTDESRNHHLALHPDRVFLVNLPVDTFYYDMEEAISHMAKFGINRTELQQKVKDCNLIKLPTNLKGYSCNLCKRLDTNSKGKFMSHVKEECKVTNKEERAEHLICFCRGCHSKFSTEAELARHVMKVSCWPSMMVINRLYDQSGAELPPKQNNASIDKEKMIRVKQEKVERAQQVQMKRERFEESEHGQPQPNPPLSPFNAYALPANCDLPPLVPPVRQPSASIPSSSDLQHILNNIQNNPVMQVQPPSLMHQVDMANMQGIHQLAQNQVFSPLMPGFVPPVFPFPPPSNPQLIPNPNMPLPSPQPSSSNLVKVERSNSPTLSVRSDLSIRSLPRDTEEPSPSFSPLRNSHRSRSRIPSQSSTPTDSHRSRSRKPSNPVVAPPAPSTPLPAVGDLFSQQVQQQRQRSPSVESISVGSSARNPKIVSTAKCLRSGCLWTDPHTSTCPKPKIMERCARNECDWYSLHRDYPLCDKLSFYCNCKKESEGVYKYYDELKQVKRINTKVDGQRDTTVMEPKNVPMRLLYRTVSRMVEDPRARLSRDQYPTRLALPSGSFRGKKGRLRGWGEHDVICTWQAVNLVKVVSRDNPHIVSDHDSDIEEVSQEIGDIGNRPKKLSKTRRNSSQDREVW